MNWSMEDQQEPEPTIGSINAAYLGAILLLVAFVVGCAAGATLIYYLGR